MCVSVVLLASGRTRRRANAVSSNVVCRSMCLGRVGRAAVLVMQDFESLLGHLRDLLERNLGMRLLLCIPIVSLLSNEEVRWSSFSP